MRAISKVRVISGRRSTRLLAALAAGMLVGAVAVVVHQSPRDASAGLPLVPTSSSATTATTAPRTVEPGALVVLWGDSLGFEAKERFVEALEAGSRGRLRVDTRTYGGTATCDWLADINLRAQRERPVAAVLEFSGNALTPCMAGPDGSPLTGLAYVAAYRDATLRAITSLLRVNAHVFLVGTPKSRTAIPFGPGEQLNELYREMAASLDGVTYVDAGAAVLGPHGEWTDTLPCLPDETASDGCVDGRIVVRAPDGAHFCPGAGPAVRGVTGMCPRWSSGALRFGRAMAEPVLRDLRFA